ncbi:MAG TPA: MinD/ParA family protein [Pseudonocardiaceae bacterium]|nr:MinD/ParA family protein [Pseudonocardiaceae bacterium]
MTGPHEEPTSRYEGPWQQQPGTQAPSQPTASQLGAESGNHQARHSAEGEEPAEDSTRPRLTPVAGDQPGPDQPAQPPQPQPPQPEQPEQFPAGPTQSTPYPVGPPPAQQPPVQQPPTPNYYAEPYGSGGQPQIQYQQPGPYSPQFPFDQQHPPGGPMAPPPPPQPGQPGQPGQPPNPLSRQANAVAQELSSAHLLRPAKRPPQTGWRRAIYQVSGRTLNLGESPTDVQRRELITRINQPLRGCYKIAMLSLKGGVGKTTTTTTLGSTFASLRGDRVIAVDANPDRGTLSQKIPLETTATVRHLLRDASRITRYSDVRSYTSQGPSRLEILASEQDPAVSEAFSEQDYRRTIDLLEHFYNIVLTDCGTGLMHSAMRGVLDIADSLVIVSSGSVDGARSASATLDWLDAHGYRDLVARSVAVINSVHPKSGTVDLDKLAEHFAARCRAVCRIPFDPHLEEGAEIELERLSPSTRLALLELGATVADDFPHDVARR